MSPRLHDHLRHDHGRQERELDGLPLAAVHRLEHLEDDMGLLQLRHRHLTGSARRRRRPAL
jgi:hypothetical protein